MEIAVVLLFIGSFFYSHMTKAPVMYLFSAVIAMATSLFMFNAELVMFGIILILVSLWQLIEMGRAYAR